MNGDVALVSALEVANRPDKGDPDADLLGRALTDVGVSSTVVCWDDPDVDWGGYRLAVLRSTWDYTDRRDEFMDWITRTAVTVTMCNPPDVVAWNTDKHYLLALEQDGLPVVPTQFFEPDQSPEPIEFDGELVVKPAIGAGSHDVARHSNQHKAEAHIAALTTQRRAALVQPYLSDVDIHGETGMVYFEGQFSHAFGKGAMLARDAPPSDDLYVRELITAREPTALERQVGDAVVATHAADLLYARVDLLRGADGRPLITELELTEPSFFFAWASRSPKRFARAIAGRLA